MQLPLSPSPTSRRTCSLLHTGGFVWLKKTTIIAPVNPCSVISFRVKGNCKFQSFQNSQKGRVILTISYWLDLTRPIWKIKIILTVWFISSCMIIASNGCGRTPTTTSRSCPATGQYCHPISACIWKWLPWCSFTMYFATAGAAHTGHRKESVLFPQLTGAMNPHLTFASKVLKKEALLQSPLIWHLSMITAATRKNGSWPVTTRCWGASSRRKSFVITHRFLKCRGTLCMWTMSAARGDIWAMREITSQKISTLSKSARHIDLNVIQ